MYKTPDTSAGETSRTFTIPLYMLPYLAGAIIQVCEPGNWELKGTCTIEEAVQIMESVLTQIEYNS